MALIGLTSEHSRRAYSSHLNKFLNSHYCQSHGLTRESALMFTRELTGPTRNIALCAIKKLAEEAYERDLIDSSTFRSIKSLKLSKSEGQRSGNWLTPEQVRTILSLPDRSTVTGKRDAALLALLIGCGLRRSEAAGLTWNDVRKGNGEAGELIVDVLGKGQKRRTIVIPAWARGYIEQWREVSDEPTMERTMDRGRGEQTGPNGTHRMDYVNGRVEESPRDARHVIQPERPLYRAANALRPGLGGDGPGHGAGGGTVADVLRHLRGMSGDIGAAEIGSVIDDVRQHAQIRYVFCHVSLTRPTLTRPAKEWKRGLTPSGIWHIVKCYARLICLPHLAPHDLRRTHAQLSRQGGVPLEVLQRSLGHSSISTTQKYIRAMEVPNSGDYIKL